MTEGELIAFLVTLIGLVGAVLTPIIRLNTTITKLNSNLEHQREEGERRNHRLDVHSERIDHLENKVTEHDVKINQLCDEHKRVHWKE